MHKGRDADDSACFLLACLVRAVGNVGRAAKDALPALKERIHAPSPTMEGYRAARAWTHMEEEMRWKRPNRAG